MTNFHSHYTEQDGIPHEVLMGEWALRENYESLSLVITSLTLKKKSLQNYLLLFAVHSPSLNKGVKIQKKNTHTKNTIPLFYWVWFKNY